jgi:hypothetical protein
MMTAEVIILIISGIAALIVQNIYFIIDDREANHTARDRRIKKYWHWAGGAIHIWMGYVIGRFFGWQWGLLMGSCTWYLFDGFINTYILRREWWFIGDTALLDITQRNIAGFLHIEHRLFSACLKHAVLIISILFLIPNLI